MKHSAKAAAKQARERDRQARRERAGGRDAPPADVRAPDGRASESPATVAAQATAVTASDGRDWPREAPADSGGTGSASGPAGGRLAQLPYALVLAGVVAGLLVMWGGGGAVNGGTLVIAGALLAGSLARLVLPDSRVGLLRSRRRLVDVALLAALGAGLLISGLFVQVHG